MLLLKAHVFALGLLQRSIAVIIYFFCSPKAKMSPNGFFIGVTGTTVSTNWGRQCSWNFPPGDTH